MNRYQHRTRLLRLLIPLLIFILGCPPSEQPPREFLGEQVANAANTGLTILGEFFFLTPDSRANLMVQVRDPNTNELMPNARVKIMLNAPNDPPKEIFAGNADKSGLIQVDFKVPAAVKDPDQMLTIVAETPRGQVQHQEKVYVGRVYNVLITTDKPVYQPGQVIHMRGLALDTTALKAAQTQPLVLTVQDAQGNKLMRKEVTTSRYGIASADFTLDTQATSGDYIITAEMGPVSSTRSVEVKPYTLPRFKINFQSDKAFYLPGDKATGTVDAQYFFGKPVTKGKVTIKGTVTDVGQSQLFELNGVTDDKGLYHYEFQVPDYFVGQLENNTAKVDLEINVTDTANHLEKVDENVTVAEKAILIEAVPESGFLQPGLENIVYLQTSYPDGKAAATELTIHSEGISPTTTLKTDEFGLARFTVTPPSNRDLVLTIQAKDAHAQAAEQQITLGGKAGADALLLRPDKAQYQIGDTLNVDLHVAGHATTAYLDIIKNRQTFGLVALTVKKGMAQAAIDIDGSLLGTLELNAYMITDKGEIVRDRRLVLVNPAPATVDLKTNASVYKPGETATLDVKVSRAGKPMQGAIGVSIVDESVFAVGAQDPGFARTYFLLERELLKPRYEIHGFAPLDSDQHSPYDNQPDSVRTGSAECGMQSAECGIKPPSLATHQSQQAALFGYFGEELAASRRAEVPQANSALRTPHSAFAMGWAGVLWPRVAFGLPLAGLAFYDGTRKRRKILIALVLFGLGAFFWSSCASPGAAPAAGGAEAAAPAASNMMADKTTATQGQAQPPRLRQLFPETLYWLPEQETDANGHVQLTVPMADSITTWRVNVLASDVNGNLGSAEVGMRVFQDFFVEPDLPRFLTVGDELAVPVSIYNYLDKAQTIKLAVAQADWFTLTDQPQLTLDLGPNEVAAAYIPIRVTNFGTHDFKLTATGSVFSDAIQRQVEVMPDGKRTTLVQNGKLAAGQTISLSVPANAVPGTARVTVKVYPGVVSQVIDGLEGMLREPNGCFEQTSSTTYPNVLVLDYQKATNQINPRVQLQAEQYINLGYQRLLSFEVQATPGGFSLFGEAPAQTMLTAYGINEFSDMGHVSYVDPALVERTANFLFQRQNADGSWSPDGMTIESGLENLGQGNLLPTAYISWALADAGYANSEPVQRAIQYLQANMPNTTSQSQHAQGQPVSPVATPNQSATDPYALALIANALVAGNVDAHLILDRLIADAQPAAHDSVSWTSNMSTWMGSSGNVASIDTTAMIAIALLRANYHVEIAQKAIDFIISQRDSLGAFYSTQTTVLALKALLLAAKLGGEGGDAAVTITLNGSRTQTMTINAENANVMQQISLDDLRNDANELALTVDGKRALQYQVITEYYLPWSAVPPVAQDKQAMRVDVQYDRTELQVNDKVNVTAQVTLLQPGVANTVLVDLGIPPGFSPIREELDQLVEQKVVSRYELTGRQIILYMTNVPSGQVYTLHYGLQARFPIKAQTPSSTAYNYYTPDQQDTQAPQRIVVKLGTPGQ